VPRLSTSSRFPADHSCLPEQKYYYGICSDFIAHSPTVFLSPSRAQTEHPCCVKTGCPKMMGLINIYK
jgi:hypothetical protein